MFDQPDPHERLLEGAQPAFLKLLHSTYGRDCDVEGLLIQIRDMVLEGLFPIDIRDLSPQETLLWSSKHIEQLLGMHA